MGERVTFLSDGLELVGYLFRPAGAEGGASDGARRPGIVLCTGFGATQGASLPARAEELARRGFAALTLDYRGFGESAGPRGRLIPLEQVADIRSAVSFLRAQAFVDPDRVGVYGSSFGGANACYAAAVDERIACVASVVGVGCGQRWLRGLRRAWEWRAFLDELAEDRERRSRGEPSRVVDRLHIMLPDPATRERAEENLRRAGQEGIPMPLETADAVLAYHPEEVVDRIAPRPVLFVVAERDVLVPNEVTRELYDRAGDPKRWVVLPGLGHYDAYGEAADVVLDEVASWFRQHLG